MRADKQCKNCEWWEVPQGENPHGLDLSSRCLRWPGQSWLVTYGTDRCWQHVKRTKETEESVLDPRPGVMVRTHGVPSGDDDLRDAARLVLEAGLATGRADTCTDLVSEVLAQVRELQEQAEPQENVVYMNLKLVQARGLILRMVSGKERWANWCEDAKRWLESG